MRLLVIGGSGFLGSNLIRYVLGHYQPEFITNVDAGVHPGNHQNLNGVAETFGARYELISGSICDPSAVADVMRRHKYFAVVHFASEQSIAGLPFLIDAAITNRIKRLVHVSDQPWPSADDLILGAGSTGGIEPLILRFAGLYGPNQWALATLPTWTRRVLERLSPTSELAPDSRRDWLHCDDACSAIVRAMLDGKAGSVFDVGPDTALPDKLVESWIRETIDGRDSPHPSGELPPAATDSSGIREALGWRPIVPALNGIRDVVHWYLRYRARLLP